MKRYFLTGLILLLPIVLTIAILIFIINLLTKPFVGIVNELFNSIGLFQDGFLFLSAHQVQQSVAQVLILITLFFAIVLLGFSARKYVVTVLIRIGDTIFHQIPFVRSIYKTSQDVIKTIFASETKSFKQVVLVPFPNPDSKTVGLVTKEALDVNGKTKIAVFVPTTPNPTSGFLMLYDEKDIIWLDLTVEEALKYVISCGVIMTDFKMITHGQAKEINQ